MEPSLEIAAAAAPPPATCTRPSATNGAASIDGMTHAIQCTGVRRPMKTMSSARTAQRQTSDRAPAFVRRKRAAARAATTSGTVARSEMVYTCPTARALSAAVMNRAECSAAATMLLPFRAQSANHASDLRALVSRQRSVGLVEERRDRGGARPTEECAEQMAHG